MLNVLYNKKSKNKQVMHANYAKHMDPKRIIFIGNKSSE